MDGADVRDTGVLDELAGRGLTVPLLFGGRTALGNR
jgi:hypothetical protein